MVCPFDETEKELRKLLSSTIPMNLQKKRPWPDPSIASSCLATETKEASGSLEARVGVIRNKSEVERNVDVADVSVRSRLSATDITVLVEILNRVVGSLKQSRHR